MHLQRLLQKSRIFATILLTSKRMVSALYRVAVCEDEAILCANLCAQCESILDKLKVEHRITSFSSAEKLENALLAGEEFSLLCLDILMGGKSGMKLAQELRQRDDKTSILFITSSTEFLKDGYRYRRQGCRNGWCRRQGRRRRNKRCRWSNTAAQNR